MKLPDGIDEINSLINRLGDICHESYIGCFTESDIWIYGYKNEVINLLDTPEAKQAILTIIERHETEAYKKGYIQAGIDNLTNGDK